MSDPYSPGFVNYYKERPDLIQTTPTTSPTSTSGDSDVVTQTMSRVTSQQSTEDARLAPVDFQKVAIVNPNSVIYSDFNQYLKSRGLPDRSGYFSGVEFPATDRAKRAAKVGAAVTATMGVGAGMVALALPAAVDSRQVSDPTGQYDRFIPATGPLNMLSSMAIAYEYDGLNKVKNSYDNWVKAGQMPSTDWGMILNVNGLNLWRLEGESLWRGQIERAGLSQEALNNLEKLERGKMAMNEVLAGSYDEDSVSDSLDNPRNEFHLGTRNGGYTLRGTFNTGTYTAAMGTMDDFNDIVQYFTNNANDPNSIKAARKFARGWLESTRQKGFGRNDKEAALKHFQKWRTIALKAEERGSPPAESVETAEAKLFTEERREEREQYYAQQQQEAEESGQDYAPVGSRDYDYGTAEESGLVEEGEEYSLAGAYFNEGGTVPGEGDIVTGEQATEEGDSILTANELLEGGIEEGGFIAKKPEDATEAETVADTYEMTAEEGGVIINASAVKQSGEMYLADLRKEAQAVLREKGVESKENGERKIQVSAGEQYFTPEEADVIGRERLRKINERGKPDTRRKIEENGQEPTGAAEGLDLSAQGQYQLPSQSRVETTGFMAPRSTVSPEFEEAMQKPATVLDDQYFGYRMGDIKEAIRIQEIQGYEDRPFIFTGVKANRKKGVASSAFGPMQITSSLLKDYKQRGEDYKAMPKEIKLYIDKLIKQGDNKVNLELYGMFYSDGKRVSTPASAKRKLRRFGPGTIPISEHEKYYDTLANSVLAHKLRDHNNLKSALASWGEGRNYAQQVMSRLTD